MGIKLNTHTVRKINKSVGFCSLSTVFSRPTRAHPRRTMEHIFSISKSLSFVSGVKKMMIFLAQRLGMGEGKMGNARRLKNYVFVFVTGWFVVEITTTHHATISILIPFFRQPNCRPLQKPGPKDAEPAEITKTLQMFANSTLFCYSKGKKGRNSSQKMAEFFMFVTIQW